ncbi:MAG: PQQ-binding-like beta-propeller repeat protein [Candidatus Brocadiia bacterium]
MSHATSTRKALRAGVSAATLLMAGAFAARGGEHDQMARQILEATGLKAGLIVHLDCDAGALTAALRANPRCLVQGLDTDAEDVDAARQHIQELGLYGPVSIELFDGRHLPYAPNLANLVVAEDLGEMPMAEALRVLAPGGTAYVKSNGSWQKTIKPRPADTDEWTHFLHDASGNAVARDTVVGPPRHVQWLAPPRHTRSHEHIPSINALVATGGRIFYVADEGPIRAVRRPAQWHLVARDAHNGLLLWKRAFSPWFPHIVNWGQTPPHLQRRLVAVGDRVYVTLGLNAPLSVVDAATGKTLEEVEGTRGTEEILCHDGYLLLVVRKVTDERRAELRRMQQLTRQQKSPLYERDSAQPIVSRFRRTYWQAERRLLALHADTRRVAWEKAPADTAGLRPASLCASGDRVYYHKGGQAVCLRLETGEEAWSQPAPLLRAVGDGTVVCAGGEHVRSLSAETGKVLWTQPAWLCSVRDAFVIDGSLWLGGFRPYQGRRKGKRGPAWGPYFAVERELATGKLLRKVEPKNPGHHHRCWRNKATVRYILSGRRGVEFVDLATAEVLWHSWVRGVCRYGVMPANGLLYAPPHACGCYIAAKLEGFYALAPGAAPAAEARAQAPRLERGPAYGQGQAAPSARGHWPTYRHDPERSGATPAPVPPALDTRWQAKVGGTLTGPTIAGGRVFLASVDEHAVCAVDADTGRAAWRFTAGARVDSPPTLHRGSAIFGCRDGCIYSVRASDGALAWRLRTAGAERRVTAWGQLESVLPVHGSVLVREGVAYCVAGRSSYLDGGLDLYRLDPGTGEVLSRRRIYSPDPETGRQPEQYGPCYMPGALADILTSDGQHVYLRDAAYDLQGRKQPQGKPHLLALTGFLDDTWPHRSYWIFGTRCSIRTGCSGVDRGLVYGRLLVFDDEMVYGYGRANVHWSNQLQDGPYRVFAVKRGESKEQWTRRLATPVRAMVLAGKVLFAAGPATDVRGEDESTEEEAEGLLVAISAEDGSEMARWPLDAPPVLDGMAAAGGRLYIALHSGHLVCMEGTSER